MTHARTHDDELLRLCGAVRDETLTAEQFHRLEQLLTKDVEARRFYIRFLQMHALLERQVAGALAVPTSATREPVREAGPTVASPPRPARRLRSWRRMAMAASLLLVTALGATVLASVHWPEAAEPPDGAAAMLIGGVDTVWAEDMSQPVETGSVLARGRLKLKSGLAELMFLGGATVVLEGPADFEITGSSSGALHRGKLLARVPGEVNGFTLEAPGIVRVERAGEFGVKVDEPGLAEVHVFAGEIRVSADRDRGLATTEGLRPLSGAGLDLRQRTVKPITLNEVAFQRLRPPVPMVDATVRAGRFRKQRLGPAPWLTVTKESADSTREVYLRFDLERVTGKIREARVRLMPINAGQAVEHAAAQVSNTSWNEGRITWQNRPSSSSPFARWNVQKGQPVEIDITRQVQQALVEDRQVSLRIFATQDVGETGWVIYGAREGPPEHRPQLILISE